MWNISPLCYAMPNWGESGNQPISRIPLRRTLISGILVCQHIWRNNGENEDQIPTWTLHFFVLIIHSPNHRSIKQKMILSCKKAGVLTFTESILTPHRGALIQVWGECYLFFFPPWKPILIVFENETNFHVLNYKSLSISTFSIWKLPINFFLNCKF